MMEPWSDGTFWSDGTGWLLQMTGMVLYQGRELSQRVWQGRPSSGSWYQGTQIWAPGGEPPPPDFDWATLIPGQLLANLGPFTFTGSQFHAGPVMTSGGTIFASVLFSDLNSDRMIAASGAQSTSLPGMSLRGRDNRVIAVQHSDGSTRRNSGSGSTSVPIGERIVVRLRWQQDTGPDGLEFDWTNGTISGQGARSFDELGSSIVTDPPQNWVIGRHFSSGSFMVGEINRIVFYGARADDAQWAAGRAQLIAEWL